MSTLDGAGKYQVARTKVRFNVSVTDDEIDLDSGFLMLPQSIPDEAAPEPAPTPTPSGPSQPRQPTAPSGPTSGPLPQPAPGTVFQVSFTADRDKLYTAWNAVANLADIAGNVEVSLRAESATGFDKGKLQNGVLEPLREADLIE